MENSHVQTADQVVAPANGAEASARTNALESLKAVVLLAGSVRPNAFAEAIGRSVLDLPVDNNRSVLGHWLKQADDLAKTLNFERLPVRVLIDRKSIAPTQLEPGQRAVMQIEHDQRDFRGTGGVLRDMAEGCDDEDWILVATAGQVFFEPLFDLVKALAATGGDVSLTSNVEGIPSSLMLLRCGCLRSIPRVGFVDMKEQALSLIAANHRVSVLHRADGTSRPITTLAAYIQAVRLYNQCLQGAVAAPDPFEEDWQATYSIVEDPESIGPLVQVHDSVVLRGGTVESGAVVVRSIVCSGGVVRRGQTAVDRIVVSPRTNGRRRRKPV